MYSTAPSSPELVSTKRRESYDEALHKPELLWEWHTGTNTKIDDHHSVKLPDPAQSPPVPKHVGSGKLRGTVSPSLNQQSIPEVISANPVNVKVGFHTSEGTNPLDTTKLSSLPGAIGVITSPPKSHIPTLSRPRSIEEIDEERRNYAPVVTKKRSFSYQERDNTGFCLDLASLTGYVAPPPATDYMEPDLNVIDGEPQFLKHPLVKPRSLSFELKDVV